MGKEFEKPCQGEFIVILRKPNLHYFKYKSTVTMHLPLLQ